MQGFGGFNQYSQSQVSSSNVETNYNQVENGGLFTRDECRNLARYSSPHPEKLLTHTTETETASAKQSKWQSGWSTATGPWTDLSPQLPPTSHHMFKLLTRTETERSPARNLRNLSSSISSTPTEFHDSLYNLFHLFVFIEKYAH